MGLQSNPITAIANASGVAVATLPTVPLGQLWDVSQISVKSTSLLTPTATINYSGQLVDMTTAGVSDTCSGDPSLEVSQKDSLTVTWNGCNPGDICVATFYYKYASLKRGQE